MMGTPDYMAPEQAMDPANATAGADLYSVGCTLYRPVLSRRTPFPIGTVFRKLLARSQVGADADRGALPQPARPGHRAAVDGKAARRAVARRPRGGLPRRSCAAAR